MGESSREMRFGVASPPGSAVQKGRGDAATPTGRPIIADETNSSSDFNQWLHAMKMVARLPGGMPPEFRRKLWLALADKYLKSKDIDWEKEEVKCFSEQWREDDEELGIQIVKDLHRTGSSLCSGPAGTINQAKLKRILLGYARFNPEVGYCQGFNMLGALILQVMDKEETESIKVMIYLVEGILPSGYFSGSLGGLQADMAVFRELMTSKLPRLAKHLQKLQGPVENAFEPPLTNVFTMQWFLTMFCTCLPMTCVLRVWDLVLIEGSDVLLRTALVLWSLLEERILSARTADDFYCQMGSFSSELLNGHLVDSNGLIEKVVDLGPIPDLQKLRDKHLYNITPFRDKKGLQLYYSDEDGDSDEESKMAVATAWGLRLRRGSAGLASKSSDGKDRIALDISLLKKQYDRLRERQRQAHIILTSAVARQGSSPNQASIQMNQLLMGRNAIVTNNGRRIGPPQGAIPPARKPSLPTSKPPKLAQTKKLLSGETLHWRDTDLSKRRRGSLKWKDIKSDSSQSGMEDRPAALVESAPSSRSSSSEAKSKRPSYKATRQRSDSSSYSEESDGNSSTSTSLCDEDDMLEHNNLSSLEGSPMRKSKSSKKHSEVTKQKSLEDVLNSNDGQPTVDNQIPFIQLTTIESPVLNANKTEIEPSLVENSETESNRLDYAGFVDEFSWPDINEQPTTSVSLEDTTTEAISEGDFLSLSNVITSTSQLSPMPDIATYINNSNISPLRTPISGFDYANLVVNIDSDPKKFDVNEEGVINEYFERVNVVERPTKLDLLYSLNEEDSIRKAYVSCEPTPESPKGVKEKPKIVEEEATQQRQASEEELDRKMKVLLEYSNKSSLSFIAEAKQEFSTGMFKEMEFDVDSLKYQPTKLVPIKRAHAVESPEIAENEPEMEPSLKVKNLAEELMEIELQSKAKEITQKEEVPEIKETKVSNIPSTEDLETRFRALEMNFSGRKESLKNEALVRKNSQRSIERDVDESRSSFVDSPSTNYSPQVKTSESLTKVNEGSGEADQRFRNSVGDIEGFSKRSSFVDSPPKHYSPQVETSECLTKVNEESCEADKRCSNSVGDVDGFSKRSSYVDSPSTHYSPQVETSENLTKVNEESGETVERPRYSVGDIDGFSKRYSFIDSPSKNYSPQVETLGSLTKVNEGSGGADQRCRNSVGDVDSFSKRSSFADSPSKHYSPQVETSECLTKVNEESGEAVQRSGNSVGELEDSHFKDLSTKKESSEYQTKDIEVLSEEIDISPKEDVVVTELSNTFTRKESTSLNRTIEEKHSPMTTETNVKEKDLSTDLKDREEEQIEDEHDTHALQTHRYSIEDRYQYSNIEHEKPLSPLMKEIPKSIENLNEDLKYDSQHYLKSEVENLMDKVETGNKQSEEIQGGASSQTESLKTEIREGAGSADENLSLEQDFMKIDTEETAILNDMNEKLHEKSSPLGQYEEVAKDPRIDRDINYSSCAAVEEQNLISQESKKPEYNDLEKQEEPLTTMKQVEEPSSSCRKSITDNPEAATLSETKSEQETDQVKTTNEKKVALDEPPEEPIVPCVASPTDDIPDSQFQSIIDETDTINLSDDRKQLLLPKDTKSKIKEILDEGVLFYEHYPAVPDGVEAGGVNDPNQSENASTQPNETQSREAESSQPQEKTPTSEDQLQPEKSIVPASSNRPDNTIVRKHDEPEPSFPTPKTIDKPQSTYSFSYTQNHFNDDVSVLSEVQGLQANQTANAIQSTFNLQHSPENLFAVTTSVSLGNSQTIRSSVSVKSSVSLKSSALYDRERSLQVNTGITVCDDPNEDSSKMISSNQLQLSGNQERSNYGAGITVSVINSEPSARTSNISLSMRLPEHSGDSLVGKTVRTDMLAQPKVLPQILDKNTSEKDKTDSDGNKADIRPADEPKTRKSSYSQEVEERLKALERRLSERVLTVSKDTKGADQPVAKEEPRQEQVLTLDDDQPMKLNVEKVSPTDSKQQKETKPGTGPEVEAMTDKEETNKVVPSTAELEHRFHELERKLSAKNIHLPATIEQPQQEDKASSTTNPSIVLTKNEGAHGERELNDSKEQKKNEEPPSTPRRRIPSTEDLENRFEALEIQKSLKSPGNLLSPSKIKEEFPPEGAIDQETKRKTEIPSTEDLESRFQALEQSKKGDDVLKKSQSQENTTKPKDVPKVTFAESSDTKKVTQNCEEKPDLFQEVSESPTSTSRTELSRERVLRKVPSAKDLEARFEALEKRKSFTGFSSKTQEHLLAEQSRNYLSSESLNTVESLKRRELCEKKVASTEDLVLRLDALEQRMAITENSIKNKISSEKELSQKTANFECRFEALDNRQSFRENIASNKTPSTSRENLQNTFKPTKETLPETKLSMIKRSLFEPEPKPKRLPSTQDLENRFDALERQKSKSSLGVKANVTREPIKTESWETPFEQIEHRTPSPFGTKPLPRWDNDTTLSRFPSTRNLDSRFEALEQQKFSTERRSNLTSTGFEVSKPSIQKTTLEKPAKAHASRSIDLVLEQISTKTEEIEREHQMLSKVPSTQDLEIRYNDLQLQTKRGNQKRRDLYKLESQSDETLTISHPTGTEFDTKSESRPTSCPEYRDPFDSNIVTTDRTLADSGGSRGDFNSTESRSGFTDSLLALGNIFPRTDESISPSRIRPQSPRVRSTITFRSDDSSITDRLASIKSTIKSIDTLCEDQSSRKDKCQRYIDSLFTSSPRSSNATSPIPIPTSHHLVASRPIIRIDDFEDGRRSPNPPAHYQERVAMREMKKEVSPRRRRDEEREEYESRVRRDTMMPNSVDDEAPSEISCSLENIANNKVDSEVDRINHKDKTQLERSISPYYAPGSDLHNRSTTSVVYVPTKLEIRHTTVTSTFYDRFLTEKHIERTFPRSKKHSPAVSPTITKSQLDISSSSGSTSLDRSSKSAENSPSRRKDSNSSGGGGGALSPNPTTTVSTAVAYKRGFLSSLEVAQKDLHIRSCDNILLQLRSSTLSNQQPMMPSITSMGYNPIPTKSTDLGISLGLYKDIHNGNDTTSSKS